MLFPILRKYEVQILDGIRLFGELLLASYHWKTRRGMDFNTEMTSEEEACAFGVDCLFTDNKTQSSLL